MAKYLDTIDGFPVFTNDDEDYSSTFFYTQICAFDGGVSVFELEMNAVSETGNYQLEVYRRQPNGITFEPVGVIDSGIPLRTRAYLVKMWLIAATKTFCEALPAGYLDSVTFELAA